MDAMPPPAHAAPGVTPLFEDARRADYLEWALAAAELGTWSWDARTDLVNPCARSRALWNLGPGPHHWAELAEHIHPDDRDNATARFLVATENHQDYEAEFRVLVADGTPRWISMRGRAHRDDEAHCIHGIVADITLRKDHDARLKDSLAEMEAFSYNISHDMRAPLRAIHSFARILDQEYGATLPPEGRDYLARILAASARMDRLIQAVLVYRRAACPELKLERVSLPHLIHTLFDAYPHLRESAAEFELADEMPTVLANDAALLQCLANVVGNAVKFVARDRRAHVRIWAEQRGGRARVFVRDNGIGISAAAQPRVFDMFFRVSAAYDGNGIGLAVTRKSIERMGGTVGVESEPGRGSTFYFDLPLAS